MSAKHPQQADWYLMVPPTDCWYEEGAKSSFLRQVKQQEQPLEDIFRDCIDL